MRNRHGSKTPENAIVSKLRPQDKVITNQYSTETWKAIAERTAEVTPDEVKHQHYDGGQSVEHRSELKIRAQQIAVGIPMDELMFSQFFENFCGLSVMPWDTIITTRSTYLPDARNQIHNKFLDNNAGTHLFMIDSDVLCPPGTINALIKRDLPMIGGWYKKKEKYTLKHPDGSVSVIQRPVVYDYIREEAGVELFSQRVTPGKGVEKVDGAGAGCWLMRRDVAEALGHSPYSMAKGGEDLDICRKITALGFDIHIDWDLAAAHCGVMYV